MFINIRILFSGSIMVDFIEKYKVISNRKNYVGMNRGQLEVSKDVIVDRRYDNKMCFTFNNSEGSTPDCASLVIDDMNAFNNNFRYCQQTEDGTYQLYGDGVTFYGTTGDDNLVMNRCQDTRVDLYGGNDKVTIFSDDREFTNNMVNLGKGNDTVIANITPNNVSESKVVTEDGNAKFISKTISADRLTRIGFNEEKNVELIQPKKVKSTDSTLLKKLKSKVKAVGLWLITPLGNNEDSIAQKTSVQKNAPYTEKIKSPEEPTRKKDQNLSKEESERKMRILELGYYAGDKEALGNKFEIMKKFYGGGSP